MAHRAFVASSAIESALVGIGVVGTIVATALGSGGRLEHAETWLTGLSCGLLVAVTSFWARRATPREIARRVDLRLGAQGALLTAFESSSRAQPGSVASLLERRVAADVTPRVASRSVRALSVTPLIAPFLGAVLLAATHDALSERKVLTLEDLSRGISKSLVSAELALDPGEKLSVEGTPVTAEELRERIREFARSIGDLDDPQKSADELHEAIARLDRERQALHRLLPAIPSVEEPLHRISALLDAARMRVERTGTGALGTTTSAAGALGPGSADGSSTEAPTIPIEWDVTGPASAVSEVSPSEVGWWKPEFDSVVAEWLGRRERAHNGGRGE